MTEKSSTIIEIIDHYWNQDAAAITNFNGGEKVLSQLVTIWHILRYQNCVSLNLSPYLVL